MGQDDIPCASVSPLYFLSSCSSSHSAWDHHSCLFENSSSVQSQTSWWWKLVPICRLIGRIRSKSGTVTLKIVDRITTGQHVVESSTSNGIVCRNILIACFNSGSVAPVAA